MPWARPLAGPRWRAVKGPKPVMRVVRFVSVLNEAYDIKKVYFRAISV
jgi:hypothetical protein